MQKINSKQKYCFLGFTLIEILISISIIALFSGITLAYYNNFTEDQKLKSESKRLISVLALARKMASASVDAGLCPVNQPFSGYQVGLTASGYNLYRCCGATCNPPPVHSYIFTENISGTAETAFLFQPLSLGVKTTDPDSTIKLTNFLNKCIVITIGQSTVDESTIQPSCP